jgi:hypothetical protein
VSLNEVVAVDLARASGVSSALLIAAVLLMQSGHALAVETSGTEAVATTTGRTSAAGTAASSTVTQSNATTSIWSASDAVLAPIWNLTVPEMQRARLLMQGPRGTFSSPQLTPIEALGIHARNDAERARYARLFARMTYEDTQRVLAWSAVAQGELQALAANTPVFSFEGAPKANVSFEAADMLGVPRSAVVPPAVRPTSVTARPAVNRPLGRAVDNRGRVAEPTGGAR